MTDTFTIPRKELVRIIEEAIPEHWKDSTKARVRRVAETTETVAVGDFYVDGARCPMRQVGLRSSVFAIAYDHAMWRRFYPAAPTYEAFFVTVDPESESA